MIHPDSYLWLEFISKEFKSRRCAYSQGKSSDKFPRIWFLAAFNAVVTSACGIPLIVSLTDVIKHAKAFAKVLSVV